MEYIMAEKSKWVGALVQLAGFSILLNSFLFLLNYLSPTPNSTSPVQYSKRTISLITLALVYVTLGLLIAGSCFLTSFGFQYLPVSTFSLICAPRGFHSSLFLFPKFTPLVINYIVLLTISSTLLLFNTDSSSISVSKGKYAIGFICTIGAAAGTGLMLALTQFTFKNIIKKQTFRAVMDVIIYQSLIAKCATLVGYFASGEWKGLKREMDEFETGKGSYVRVSTLFWTMIAWQVFSIVAVGLIFEVSSLFCHVISGLGLSVVQVLAVIVFHDRMHGLKVVD